MGLKLCFEFVFYKDFAPMGLFLCLPPGFEIRFFQSFREEIRAISSSEKSAVQKSKKNNKPQPEHQKMPSFKKTK